MSSEDPSNGVAEKPSLTYFPIRGRGEPIRLVFAALKKELQEEPVDRGVLKGDRTHYPFGQVPRYRDDQVDMCQSNAILRHLGRKHGLYGRTDKDMCMVDMLLDGVEAIKLKYLNMIYGDRLSDESKEAFFRSHCDPETTAERNGGAHFQYLSDLISGNDASGSGFCVGSDLTIADIVVFDMVDMMLRIYGDSFCHKMPKLCALHGKIASLEGIKTYIDSGRRHTQQNGIALG